MNFAEYLKLRESPKIKLLLETDIISSGQVREFLPGSVGDKICSSNLINGCRKTLVYAALIFEQLNGDPNLIARVVNPFLFIGHDSINSLINYCCRCNEDLVKITNLLQRHDFSYGQYTGDMFTLIMTMEIDSVPDVIISEIVEFARDDRINFGNKMFAYETISNEYIRLLDLPRERMEAEIKNIMSRDMVAKAIDFYYLISEYCKPGTMDKIQQILQR